MEERKNRIALLVQYDGARFNGWQIQNKGRTVQGEIEKALKILSKKEIKTIASGRTDAGVHAFGQVLHFDFYNCIPLKKLCQGINGILENDISVKNAYLVNPSFHARYSAIRREYLYLIYNHPQRSPFLINKAMWINYTLDIDFLKKISIYFIGEKDYASFCKKASVEENTVRRIDEFEITKKDELIFLRINGTAFLHNMIRIIVGTMLEIAKNKLDPDHIVKIFEEKNRKASGKTAPAYGLYLNQVIYNPPLSGMESAF